MQLRFKAAIAIFLSLAAFSASAAHTQVCIVLSVDSARPGDTVLAGVHLHMDPGWHTYWTNSGASGMETKITWELPSGISAGPAMWPVPEKLPPDDLITYIYEHDAVVLVPLNLASNLAPGAHELKAKLSWLECQDQCVPGSAEVTATLNVGSETKPSAEAAFLESWKTKMPQSGANLSARAWWEKPPQGDSRPLIIEWKSATPAAEADFFPQKSDNFEVQGATERLPSETATIRLRKQVKKYEGTWPKEISGLVIQQSANERAAYNIAVPIGSGENVSAGSISFATLIGALGFAFLGGLILNIMPCVLPVIALKVLSFVKQSGEEPRRARRLSLVYALGILASFLVLAIFLIAAQEAGHTASWGMQMQSRNFLLGMTMLVTLVALNLFGVYEVTLGGGAMSAAHNLSAKSGATGAFFNGVLATALAIPCTAPFLATALAFAFGQPPGIILLTFCFIALGLAAPYIVLTWNPGLLKSLPKPGPWMQRFKVALGFPMLATVVWLYKLTLNHLTKSQSLWFGIFLVTLACAAWMWGEFVQRGRARRLLAAVISLVLVGSVGAYATTRHEDLQWKTWSAGAVEATRKAGHPVLVDFTADWCLTCQLNLRTSIDVREVREKLASTGAVPMVADYTLQNENIAQELHRFGRDAVPLVVVFPKDPAAEPIVLPPVLKPSLVLDALDRAAK